MKRKNLLKSLLVAVGLLVGGNAWGTAYTGTVGFNAQNRITKNADGTFTTSNNAGNQYALALADFSGIENFDGASSVSLDFDFKISSGSRWVISIGDKNTRGTNANGSSKSTYNTDGLIMRFGTTDGTYFRVNGGTNNSDAFGVDAHCSFTLDVVNKKYTYSITKKDDNSVLFSATNVSTDITSASVVEAYSWLSNATVSLSDINYSFEYDAASYTYTVNAVDADNNILKVLGTNVATEPTTVVYPYAINVDGTWYVTTATTFGVVVNALSPKANITYEKDEDIVAFFEGETDPGTDTRYSNGGTGHANSGNSFNGSGKALGTFAPGLYEITASFTANGNRGLYVHNNTETIIANLGLDKYSSAGKYTKGFYLAAETALNLTGYTNSQNKPNQSADFDYIVIRDKHMTISSMSIVGDFSENKWEPDNGIAMTQDATNPSIWTTTLDDYFVKAKTTFEYKSIANGKWGDYELPSSGNYSKELEAGTYTLTFTVNTLDNTLTLDAVKKPVTYTVYFVNEKNWTNVNVWVWNESTNLCTNTTWPGDAATKIDGKQYDSHDVYSYSLTTTEVPANIIFNDGTNQTNTYVFKDKALYGAEGEGLYKLTINITDAGYATYCSPFELDFTGVEGLTAYKASITEKIVSFDPVTTVPANEGLLLKGNAGEYKVQAIIGATAIENALVGVTESKTIEAGSFVLLKGGQGVGFYKTQNAFTVGANTAYLPAIAAPARDFIGFGDDTTTSINAISNEKMNGEVYNLNGQRVVAPAKGLYIVNGKKVVLK